MTEQGFVTTPALDSGSQQVAGVAVEWVFASPIVRISRYRCQESHGRLTDVRSQPMHVIVFPGSGAWVLRSGDRAAVVDVNSIVFFNALEPYRTQHPFGCGDDGSALAASPEVLREAIGCHDPAVEDHPERPFVSLQAPAPPRIFLLQKLMLAYLACGCGDDLLIEESAIRLIEAAVALSYAGSSRASKQRAAPRSRRDLVEAAKELLAERFRSSLQLDEIARTLAVSPYHLCRVFKRETGLSVHRYLNRLRLRSALTQLTNERVPLLELALDLGFSSHSHFTAAFHRELGFPPSDARSSWNARRLRQMVASLKL